MYKILLVSLLFSISKSDAQVNRIPITLLDDWSSHPVPTGMKIIDEYSHDTTCWTVFSENGIIHALDTYHIRDRVWRPGDSLPSAVSVKLWEHEKISAHRGNNILQVDDGYLIGISNGEFAAALLWYSKDGSQSYRISDDEVNQIIRKDGKIYAIQGLDHLNSSEGSVIEINKKDTHWLAKTYLKLPAAPVGIDIDSKDNFIVATSDQLIKIDKAGEMETLIKTPIWRRYNYLYPESVFIQDDIVYVGMRKGIFKYDLNTKKEEWLMKD